MKKSVKKEFDYKTIKTYEDACKKLGIDPLSLPDVLKQPEKYRNATIAHHKLMIIYEAINNGWVPDWSNFNQYKYYPWFEVVSSGFAFSASYYDFTYLSTDVGSRLCTDSREKAVYIAKQFEAEYKSYLL
jgi:hypothetical protein